MTKISNAVQAQNNTNGAVQEAAKKSINQKMSSFLDGEGLRKRFDELLGARAPQFISSVVALVNSDPNMQQAFMESPMTVIQSALKAATFDLPIDQNLGYAYIMPFNNNKKQADGTWVKKKEATFILGWKGMHQLALRTGAYKTINVVDVREGELLSYNRLTEDITLKFVEDESERQTRPVIGYVGYYRLVNGAEKTIYKTVEQIQAHEKKFRKGAEMSKGWRDDWDAMARKTVYRELIGKWGVMSIEYQSRGDAAALADQMREEQSLETAEEIPTAEYTVVEEEVQEDKE